MTITDSTRGSTIVVGGGLAGLAAAAVLADGGQHVVVLEGRDRLGGRATTDEREGHLFNQGPHALYLDGDGIEVLSQLGIEPTGGVPTTKGALGVVGDEPGLLPGGLSSLLRTPLLALRDKPGLATALAHLPRIDPTTLGTISTADWLADTFPSTRARDLVAGLVRVSTYCADLDLLSADVGVAQLQLAFKGVRYLDGGWQQLVESLADRASSSGAEIRPGARVVSIGRPDEPGGAGLHEVVTTEGRLQADNVIVAVSTPGAAARLTASAALEAWAATARPITAATLDVGLSDLSVASHRFAYGIDRPLYYSVHNPPADLGAGATLHVMKYLDRHEQSDGHEVRNELESFLDLLQPGWRNHLTTVRFQRRLVVSNALPTSDRGGAAGRFPIAVPDRAGVLVAGDWVGPHGHLADASLTSGRDAAAAILEGRSVAVPTGSETAP